MKNIESNEHNFKTINLGKNTAKTKVYANYVYKYYIILYIQFKKLIVKKTKIIACVLQSNMLEKMVF